MLQREEKPKTPNIAEMKIESTNIEPTIPTKPNNKNIHQYFAPK